MVVEVENNLTRILQIIGYESKTLFLQTQVLGNPSGDKLKVSQQCFVNFIRSQQMRDVL
ncbi:hypothetical protein JDF658_26840, partial [Carboxydocella sp. JDF658]